MDNIYFVEPNSNTVVSQELPVQPPNVVVVVQRGGEQPDDRLCNLTPLRNEIIGASQFGLGLLFGIVGVIQISSLPKDVDDFKFYLSFIGGMYLAFVGIWAVGAKRRKITKGSVAFVICSNVICVLLMVAVVVVNTINFIGCSETSCYLISISSNILACVGMVLSAWQSYRTLKSIPTEEQLNDVQSFPYDHLTEFRPTVFPPEQNFEPQEAPPPYEQIFPRRT